MAETRSEDVPLPGAIVLADDRCVTLSTNNRNTYQCWDKACLGRWSVYTKDKMPARERCFFCGGGAWRVW